MDRPSSKLASILALISMPDIASILSKEIDPNTGEVVIPSNLRLSVLKQDHYAFDEFEVLKVVLMGNQKLYKIMEEKDRIYANPDFSEADGVRASELETEFAELNGWEAESEAGIMLAGLGVSETYTAG